MIHRHRMLVFALVLLPFVASGAFAATTTGKIVKLDAKAKTLTVNDGMADRDFHLGSSAMVLDGTKTISLGKLKEGDRVEVDYSDQGGKHVATRVAMRKIGTSYPDKK